MLPSLKIGSKEIAVPIIQGGMAVRISTAYLAAEVANQGGVGVIGASGMSEEELRQEIREARALSRLFKGLIGVNIMVAITQFKDLLRVALEEKVDFVLAGAGFSRDLFLMAKDTGVELLPIVSSVKAAQISEKLGAKAVVLESGEAGGHLGTDKPLFSILSQVVKSVKIPVIAAGGILYPEDIKRAFQEGARGVQMGTRFAASEESNPHQNWKDYYLQAKPEDVVIIESPAGLPGQAIRNLLIEKIIRKSKEYKPRIIKTCQNCLKKCKRNFCILDTLILAQQGDVENGLIFSGKRVGEIKEILPVKEIFRRLLAGLEGY